MHPKNASSDPTYTGGGAASEISAGLGLEPQCSEVRDMTDLYRRYGTLAKTSLFSTEVGDSTSIEW